MHLALGRDPLSRQLWFVVIDEPVSLQTFRQYTERFQIEEELLDQKSNRFQLERSELRSVPALSRLCLVLAVTTLFLHFLSGLAISSILYPKLRQKNKLNSI